MSKYNKLIGALVGNVVAILLAWAATAVPGIAECTVAPASIDPSTFDSVCSVLGFSQAQVTAALMVGVNGLFVYLFPPNKPSAA